MRSITTIAILIALSACGKKAPESATEAVATTAAVTPDSEAKAAPEAEPCDEVEAEARPDVAAEGMPEGRDLPKVGCPDELEPGDGGPTPIE